MISIDFPEVSKTALFTIVADILDSRKLCGQWVSKMLTSPHKDHRLTSAHVFWTTIIKRKQIFPALTPVIKHGLCMSVISQNNNSDIISVHANRTQNSSKPILKGKSLWSDTKRLSLP